MTRLGAWGGASPATCRTVRPHIPRARVDRGPDLQPAAGHYLLAGIDAALPHLTCPPGQRPATRWLADELRTALARTAACGDTCRVRVAADDVRLAANLLLAGSVEGVLPALLSARSALLPRRSTGEAPTWHRT